MARTILRGAAVQTSGDLPAVGSAAPGFRLVDTDLAERDLAEFRGRRVVLNIFPSIDTPVCQQSVRRFNELAAGQDNAAVLCISADLPFAHSRFCGAEGIARVASLSSYRSPEFGSHYGMTMIDGAFAGLLARAVVVLDERGTVVHTELVPAIGQEPDYDAAMRALAALAAEAP